GSRADRRRTVAWGAVPAARGRGGGDSVIVGQRERDVREIQGLQILLAGRRPVAGSDPVVARLVGGLAVLDVDGGSPRRGIGGHRQGPRRQEVVAAVEGQAEE